MPVPQYDPDSTKGYRIFVSGIKGVIRILIIVCLIVLTIFLVRWAYRIGYDTTGSKPLDPPEHAVRTMVIIDEDMSVKDIADLLKSRGLIDEDSYAFVLQEYLSPYHDEIVPGTYVLDSSMTVEEMLKVMARDGEEEEEDAE